MKVVLDTNAFISCVGKKSAYRNVFDAYLAKRYTLCITSEILLEYKEKFTEFWGVNIAENLLGRLLTGSNTSLHAVYYYFNLVSADPDDNKFADTYLTANADYLVSNDHSLLALGGLGFPLVRVATLRRCWYAAWHCVRRTNS